MAFLDRPRLALTRPPFSSPLFFSSENTLIKEKLGWAPTVKLLDGLRVTYAWIKGEMEKDTASGVNKSVYATSTICATTKPTELGTLRKADGQEGL